MKRAEGIVEILEAFDLTGSYRAAAELAGCSRREGIIAGQTVEAKLLLGIWGRLTRHGLVDDVLARHTDLSLIERLGS